MFCVTTAASVPACSSSASLRCVRFGCASSASKYAVVEVEGTRLGLASEEAAADHQLEDGGTSARTGRPGCGNRGCALGGHACAAEEHQPPGGVSATQLRNVSR